MLTATAQAAASKCYAITAVELPCLPRQRPPPTHRHNQNPHQI